MGFEHQGEKECEELVTDDRWLDRKSYSCELLTLDVPIFQIYALDMGGVSELTELHYEKNCSKSM